MLKRKNLFKIIAGVLVLALVIGVAAFAYPIFVKAQESQPITSSIKARFEYWGATGFPGKRGDQTFLAEALGITEEELEAAQKEASEAALDKAVEAGVITQEQADAMKVLGMGYRGRGDMRFGKSDKGTDLDIDYEALLADALDISVEELQNAKNEALELAKQNAIDNGKLSEEQIEMMTARKALIEYLPDRNEMLAGALGITVEELDDARVEGKTIFELMEEVGLTRTDFITAMQTVYEEAMAQAVEEGVITQEQAEQMQNSKYGHGRFDFGGKKMSPGNGEFPGGRRGRDKSGGCGRGGGLGFPADLNNTPLSDL